MLFIAALYSSFRFIIPMNPSPDLAGGEKNSDRNSFFIYPKRNFKKCRQMEKKEKSLFIYGRLVNYSMV